ncbi:MAG: hypothetical protein H6906_07315 [Hyphomicrobiales bacterium]|nr:hypothetical protein [Hyphomicrobiales bacterium]
MGRTLFIINPAGNGGAGRRVWDTYRRGHGTGLDAGDVAFTRRPGHARALAAGAEGVDLIVAVGGDGTAGEVLSGIMERPVPRPALALLPAGTGNDIARHVGAYPLDRAIRALDAGAGADYDLIRIDCLVDGAAATRHAFVYGTAGFSALVKFRPWMKRLLGASVGSYLSTILAMFPFRPPRMSIRWDDGAAGGTHRGPLWMAVVANAEHAAGASMRIAPGADTADGWLDVSLIPARPKPVLLATLLPKVPSGRHVQDPGVRYFRATGMTVETDAPMLVEIDGDIHGATPATFTVCPRAVRIVGTKES